MIARVAPVLLAIAAGPAWGQAAEPPRVQADALVETLVRQGVSGFLDRPLAETPLGASDNARRSIQDGRQRWVREFSMLGIVVGHEFAGERNLSPSVRSLCYVLKYRRTPMMLHFRFYRTERDWDLLGYGWQNFDNLRDWDCFATP